VEQVSKNEALWAIVGWMGSYEGMSGTTLEDLTIGGATDEALTNDWYTDGGEGIPADIVAGYRLARAMAEKHDSALLRERARRR
jgi:hypothetical protein